MWSPYYCYFLLIFLNSSKGFSMNFKPKDFRVTKLVNCENTENYPIKWNGTLNSIKKGKITFNGDFIISEDVTGPLQYDMTVVRCSTDLSRCENYDKLSFKKICHKIADKDALWTPFIGNIKPKFECPLKKGTYELKDGTFDFSTVTVLPLEGNIWQVTHKFYRIPDGEPKSPVFCLQSDVHITIPRISKNN